MLVRQVVGPAGHLGQVGRHCQRQRSLPRLAPESASHTSMMATEPASALLVASDGACTWLPASHSPQEVLAQRANGAYTTASVLDECSVVDWRLHVQRLVRNMRCLHDERPPSFQTFMTWLSKQDRSAEEVVAEGVQPRAALALAKLAEQRQQLPSTTQAETEQVMLTIVLEDGSSTSNGSHSAPLLVTVLCKPFPRPSPSAHVKVMVHGAPRRWAHAKHCQWVVDRRTLEAAKPPGTAEVLLCSEEGAVVEGFVSNFYVIAGNADPAQPSAVAVNSTSTAANSSANRGLQGLTLVTNGPHEPALQGITQTRVLQAAARIGLPVKLASPQLDERHLWQEAIISNCLKGMQPVSKITKLHTEGGTDGWELELPHAYGPATQQLQAALAELQELTDARSWL